VTALLALPLGAKTFEMHSQIPCLKQRIFSTCFPEPIANESKTFARHAVPTSDAAKRIHRREGLTVEATHHASK
jgi:hypothetical protein